MVVVCGARGLCASSLTEQPPLESRSHTESHPPARTGARRAQSLAATQLDLDACLRAIGVANGLAAAVGAFPNYTPLSLCLVTHRLLKQSEVAEQREAGGQKDEGTLTTRSRVSRPPLKHLGPRRQFGREAAGN